MICEIIKVSIAFISSAINGEAEIAIKVFVKLAKTKPLPFSMVTKW